jgi:hypothetical protein
MNCLFFLLYQGQRSWQPSEGKDSLNVFCEDDRSKDRNGKPIVRDHHAMVNQFGAKTPPQR